MGLELQAIELESEVEWAEAQGRYDDARGLHLQLVNVLHELADVSALTGQMLDDGHDHRQGECCPQQAQSEYLSRHPNWSRVFACRA